MKKTLYMMLLLSGIIVTTTACSNPVKEEQLKLSEEVTRVTQENQELKEEIQQLQQNNQELDEEIAKLDPARADIDAGNEVVAEESIFNIYAANIDTYEKELKSQVKIADNLTLEEKLESLGKSLSESEFESLGIDITSIEDNDGKKIATINLTENPNQGEASWKSKYFQGSTGGIVTTVTLEETFLQREYTGEWIDGVKFLYEGEVIGFDHVESLGQVIQR